MAKQPFEDKKKGDSGNPKEDAIENAKQNEPVYHVVQEKETMYALSRKYNVSEEQIRNLNNMSDNNLKVGQRLRIR